MKKILVFVLGIVMMFAATDVSAQAKKRATTKKKTVTAVAPSVNRKSTKRAIKAKDYSIKVKIVTDSGAMIVKLYDSTPLHRDNFAKLVSEKFYDSLLFHRVISAFMIQGGDPNSKTAEQGAMLGNGGGDMARIPAEFRSTLFHKKGTLCAARDGNPEKASSACQFYIVQGKKFTDEELNNMPIQYTPEQKIIYKTVGGTPFLDQNYTVFGEVISGMEVIDKIASVQKGMADRPVGDVRMKMEIIK
jgi:cyclophilin family peptidyl-prolyl cis-trans isomerase